jgi:hypothetical protein
MANASTISLVLVAFLANGCHKDGPLPGQSDVPPPGTSDSDEPCQAVTAQGSTLLASKASGWGIVLPGDAWEVECADSDHANGKLASTLGESLIVSVTRVDGEPNDERDHLDAIYTRAIKVLPQAGAKAGPPKFVLARATARSPEKTVLVYEVLAEGFSQAGMRNFHGWSIVRVEQGSTYECHLSATIKKQIDWPEVLAKHLSSCLPLAHQK